MKILVLCYEFPPVGGGGGRAAASIAEELVRRGHELRVQTSGMRHLPRHEKINGVEIFRTESFRRREETCTVPEMALFLTTSLVPTLRHLREWKPEVMHAHFAVPTGALAYAAHRVSHIPYVLTVQLGDVPGGVPEQTDRLFRLLNPAIRPIWERAAGVTVVSEFVRELAARSYRSDVVKIPNGIDLTGRLPAPQALGQPLRLMAVGRFNAQKNFPFLLDALARLKDLAWTLDLVGDGPERTAITWRLTEGQFGERVALHGWRAQEEVDQLMSRADLLLIPSLSEGLPVVGVQALKHGLAIVGSDIPGLADVIDHEVNGLRIFTDDPAVFADALRRVLTQPSTLLAMKCASWEKAHAFDLRTVVAPEYELVLQDAARRR